MAPQTKLAPASRETAASVEAPIELSIVMPCLNEAETLGDLHPQGAALPRRIGRQRRGRHRRQRIDRRIAPDRQRHGRAGGRGARARLWRGAASAASPPRTAASSSMGDADDSYDFDGLMPFVESLRAGADLVMGNRFAGGIAPGAMPLLHRYLGNPVLSTSGACSSGCRSRISTAACAASAAIASSRSALPRRAWSSPARWWSSRRSTRSISARCRRRLSPTGAAARRTCAHGATAGGICDSC